MKITAVLTAGLLGLASVASGGDPGPGIVRVDPPAGSGALAPKLCRVGDGILATWLEPAEGDGYRLRMAKLDGASWGPPTTIIESRDFFANWADVPSAARGANGALYTHWPQKSGEDTYAYDVMLARSSDSGRSWRVLGAAHDDGTETEHGFVSLLPAAGGVQAFWLDGREMAIIGDDGPGAMTLRTAFIGDAVQPGAVLDTRVCECCPTSATMTGNGPVIVYRDRGRDEVRDIAIVRYDQGTWTKPKMVHGDGWLTTACPVNGPAVDTRDGVLAVAWYTGAVAGGAVQLAFSRDAGATFGPPVSIDDSQPLGRVGLDMLSGGEALVSWLDGSGGGSIKLRRVSPAGGAGEPFTVATSSTSRAAGIPQIAVAGSTVLVVWTAESETTRLRGSLVPLHEVPSP